MKRQTKDNIHLNYLWVLNSYYGYRGRSWSSFCVKGKPNAGTRNNRSCICPLENLQPLDDCHDFKLLTCDVYVTLARGISHQKCAFPMLVRGGCVDHGMLSFLFSLPLTREFREKLWLWLQSWTVPISLQFTFCGLHSIWLLSRCNFSNMKISLIPTL